MVNYLIHQAPNGQYFLIECSDDQEVAIDSKYYGMGATWMFGSVEEARTLPLVELDIERLPKKSVYIESVAR